MINKDYEYLEGILAPTVKLNKEHNTILRVYICLEREEWELSTGINLY